LTIARQGTVPSWEEYRSGTCDKGLGSARWPGTGPMAIGIMPNAHAAFDMHVHLNVHVQREYVQ
jgi:hypothetical protein